MEYRTLGRSGLKVSSVALGSWLTYGAKVDVDRARACVRAAFDAGVIFFDTADVYAGGKAEEVLGVIVKDYRRSDWVLATKCYFPMSEKPNDRGLSRKHVMESADASLARLGTDYIDLFQCHRYDDETPLSELVRAMDDLVRMGKVLYWGVSCWSAEQVREVCRLADAMGAVRPISNQPPYSLLRRDIEDEVVPACLDEGLGQVVFSPLAQGILTGKYSGNARPEGSRATEDFASTWLKGDLRTPILDAVDGLVPIAEAHGVTMAQLSLAWCLAKPGISSVICGASSAEQVAENVAAAELALDADAVARIEAAIGDVRLRGAV